jgi:hypothetical protein
MQFDNNYMATALTRKAVMETLKHEIICIHKGLLVTFLNGIIYIWQANLRLGTLHLIDRAVLEPNEDKRKSAIQAVETIFGN